MAKFVFILLFVLGTHELPLAQEKQYKQLKKLYSNQQYLNCYKKAGQTNHFYGLIYKGLSFYRLPDNQDIKKQQDNPLLHTLHLVEQAKQAIQNQEAKDKKYLTDELSEIQKIIFAKAKKLYSSGNRSKATLYFNTLHRTFDDSNPLFVNHNAFDDSHFKKTLRSNIIKEEQNITFYSAEIEKRIDQHYDQNQKLLNQWDNPVYRLANSAKKATYLTREEKMIYYYLNLVRMNPQLFLKTFIKPRLHVKYHGEIEVIIPVYDTLKLDHYDQKLKKEAFYNLPVHKIYQNEIPENTASQFIDKKLVHKDSHGERYRYNINYTGLYNYLENNRPELLIPQNLSKFISKNEGQGLIRFKLYNKTLTYYNKTFEEETANSFYYQSLFKKLSEMKPTDILQPDHQLFKTAECWAVEAGKKGLKGHDRIKCKKNYDAEACDYGNDNGFDVVLNLLVDKFVPSLGHRKVLLGKYSELGAAIRPHNSDLHDNAVLDFNR